jgi:molybdopterin-guanine dinucleotide biosynthesis protein MobB
MGESAGRGPDRDTSALIHARGAKKRVASKVRPALRPGWDQSHVKALQIVGRKKSGKTGLLVRLIPLLQAQGLRVGTVKHSSHPHALDREGSDSWLHRKAGAEVTLGLTAVAGTLHFSLPEGEECIQSLVDEHLGHLDLVLIEGWSGRKGAKIEVLPADKDGQPREPRVLESGELLAVVLAPGLKPAAEVLARWGLQLHPPGKRGGGGAGSARAADRGIPAFHWDDVHAVAELILAWRSQP